MKELVESLQGFLVGDLSLTELSLALTALEWDSEVTPGLREAVARIRLLATEAVNEMRPGDDLVAECAVLLRSIAEDEGIETTDLAYFDAAANFGVVRFMFSWLPVADTTYSEFAAPSLELAPTVQVGYESASSPEFGVTTERELVAP